jgi:tetratricopeptide (TPR) repeat protein
VLGRYDEALMEPGVPAYMEAVLQASAGRYDAARQTIAKAVAPAEADGDRWRSSGLYFVAAMLAIEQRDFAAALAACQAADAYVMRLPPERQRIDRVLMALLRGVAEVRRGRLDAARSELTAQTELYRSSVPVERWWHDALAGEIALASGDLNAAARWFESGRPPSKIFVASLPQGSVLVNDLLLRDGSARVARARGDLRDSGDRYRQLLRYGPDQVWMATLAPRYVLELARVLDQLGDRAAARLEYQRFLRLWNHADAGLPEVSEATRAIARLAA